MTLVELFKAECTKLADAICDIADADGPQAKRKKFLLLLGLLGKFRNGFDALLWLTIRDAIANARDRSLRVLPKDLHDKAELTEDQYTAIAKPKHEETKKRLLLVLLGIQSLGSRLSDGRDAMFRLLLGAPRGELPTDSAAREKLRDKIIQVRGSDGIDRSYPPGHYATLLEDGAVGTAQRDVAIQVADNIDSDLVQISEATHKDWCDLYAGGIYSRDGNDPRVYPLSIVPGQGHMHPQCVHYLIPVAPDQYTDAQLRARSKLPREFVDLALTGNASASDYTKLFLQRRPKDWGL